MSKTNSTQLNDTKPAAPLQPRPADDHPDYPQWLCRAVGAELIRCRADLGKTAMELAVAGHISDQTILNNEGGLKNPGLATLARHCQRLGTSLEEVMERLRAAAVRRRRQTERLP